jgi:hypothetical protein
MSLQAILNAFRPPPDDLAIDLRQCASLLQFSPRAQQLAQSLPSALRFPRLRSAGARVFLGRVFTSWVNSGAADPQRVEALYAQVSIY